jgi:two-component system NtrC family response regulator
VDVRIIAATNKNLEVAIADGKFRDDLYYRLNVVSIALPPLRDRSDDVPLLLSHFIEKYNEEFQRRIRGVSPEALDFFLDYAWPGNVRELRNIIERAVITCRSDLIELDNLPPALRQQKEPGASASDLSAVV